jgi:hypothetical protein
MFRKGSDLPVPRAGSPESAQPVHFTMASEKDTADLHQPSAAFKAVTINRFFATSRHRRTRLVLEP